MSINVVAGGSCRPLTSSGGETGRRTGLKIYSASAVSHPFSMFASSYGSVCARSVRACLGRTGIVWAYPASLNSSRADAAAGKKVKILYQLSFASSGRRHIANQSGTIFGHAAKGSHRIDPHIDRERDWVETNLFFVGTAEAYAEVDRPNALRTLSNLPATKS
jgi:hypothetical protein